MTLIINYLTIVLHLKLSFLLNVFKLISYVLFILIYASLCIIFSANYSSYITHPILNSPNKYNFHASHSIHLLPCMYLHEMPFMHCNSCISIDSSFLMGVIHLVLCILFKAYHSMHLILCNTLCVIYLNVRL